MVSRSQMRALGLPAGLFVLAGVVGCQPPSSPAASAKTDVPAKVKSPVKEADLATVELTPEAEKRLGLKLVPVERKMVPLTSTYGGEVVIPSGRLISVTSPFIGTIKAPASSGIPRPGTSMKEGQPVFVLIPILSPESRATMAPLLIEAEGQVKQANEQLKIARVVLDRAENLVRDRLGGSASLIDAKAQYDLAQTNLRAAESRKEILAKVASEAESGALNMQTIESPAAGMLQNLHARAGQKVAAGAPLFEVASLDPVWVRVPVYVGDLSRLATDREAGVGGLADAPGAAVRVAKPVAAPPSGDPLAATVHVFYEVENHDGALRPGQRVGVTLPMRGEEQSLVVPLAALLRDIHGDAWVYEKTGEHAYTRRRVLVDRVAGDLAVLAGGRLKPGVEVVTDGAAELFGSEFGGAK
jgi:membrane fusion protein, heavy metal efflux system